MDIKCKNCSASTEDSDFFSREISISGSIMGDENIDTFYYCSKCSMYTVESYRDSFSGGDSAVTQGPIAKEKGDASVALIKSCQDPSNKRCRCKAHRKYFGNCLD